MDGLSALRRRLREKRAELKETQAEKQRCLDMAAAIDLVYKRMKQDKEIMEDYREDIKRFYREKYDRFDGDVYDSRYKVNIEQLKDEYKITIKNIDTNMDRLNTEKARYENEAYRCNGLIGIIQSAINSIVHQIENWTN